MLKKLLIASAVLATSSTIAFAGTPYIGMGLGVEDVATKVQNDNLQYNKLNGRSAVLNLFAGYGEVVNQNIYLGGELFANLASAQAKVDHDANNYAKVIAKNSMGISFIPGLMVSEHTMAFLRAGIVRTAFNVKTVSTDAVHTGSKSNNRTGGQLGLGIQTSLAQNIDLRGEYVYTSYKSFNVKGDKLSPSSDQFNLAVVYKFN